MLVSNSRLFASIRGSNDWDIRASERRMHLRVREIFALATGVGKTRLMGAFIPHDAIAENMMLAALTRQFRVT